MKNYSFSLISKDCLGIFTFCFSLLFSLHKFEKQTYFRKPRGEVFLINSSIWILKRNFKSIVNIGGISLMFETLIIRSQIKSDEPAKNMKTFFIFHRRFIAFHCLSTFGVPTRRFWTKKWGDEPATNW